MTAKKKKPLNRDQALNDATSGQFGEEPRPDPVSGSSEYDKPASDISINEPQDSRIKTARKMSRDL
jgi:hypothetical protein